MVEYLEIKLHEHDGTVPENLLIEAKLRDKKPIAITWEHWKRIGFNKAGRVTLHCTGFDRTHYIFENSGLRLKVLMDKRIFDHANWYKNLSDATTLMAEGSYKAVFVSPAMAVFEELNAEQ